MEKNHNWWKTNYKVVTFLAILAILMHYNSVFSAIPFNSNDSETYWSQNTIETTFSVKSSASYVDHSIIINATSVGVDAHNWNWAVSQDWCNGTGTLEDPYVIQNLTVNANTEGSCLEIHNSNDVHFSIISCEFYNASNSDEAGIHISNSSNGMIESNYIHSNNYGVYLTISPKNITIQDNVILNNELIGIYTMPFGDNITILQNRIESSEKGLYLHYILNSIIKKNEIMNHDLCGMHVYGMSKNNTFTENSIHHNAVAGLNLSTMCFDNIINYNQIFHNLNCGIYLSQASNNNLIYGNLVFGNDGNGIDARQNAGNLIYYNALFENQGNNGYCDNLDHWNTSSVGNYWGDYEGTDDNNDGIGDTAYSILVSHWDYKPVINFDPWILNSPLEEIYWECDAFPQFEWLIIDDFVQLATYNVYIDSKLVLTDQPWTSGDIICIDLASAMFQGILSKYCVLTIEFTDGIGKSIVDSKILNFSNMDEFNPPEETTDDTSNPSTFNEFLDQYSIIAGSGLIALTLLGSALIKRKKVI